MMERVSVDCITFDWTFMVSLKTLAWSAGSRLEET